MFSTCFGSRPRNPRSVSGLAYVTALKTQVSGTIEFSAPTSFVRG